MKEDHPTQILNAGLILMNFPISREILKFHFKWIFEKFSKKYKSQTIDGKILL